MKIKFFLGHILVFLLIHNVYAISFKDIVSKVLGVASNLNPVRLAEHVGLKDFAIGTLNTFIPGLGSGLNVANDLAQRGIAHLKGSTKVPPKKGDTEGSSMVGSPGSMPKNTQDSKNSDGSISAVSTPKSVDNPTAGLTQKPSTPTETRKDEPAIKQPSSSVGGTNALPLDNSKLLDKAPTSEGGQTSSLMNQSPPSETPHGLPTANTVPSIPPDKSVSSQASSQNQLHGQSNTPQSMENIQAPLASIPNNNPQRQQGIDPIIQQGVTNTIPVQQQEIQNLQGNRQNDQIASSQSHQSKPMAPDGYVPPPYQAVHTPHGGLVNMANGIPTNPFNMKPTPMVNGINGANQAYAINQPGNFGATALLSALQNPNQNMIPVAAALQEYLRTQGRGVGSGSQYTSTTSPTQFQQPIQPQPISFPIVTPSAAPDMPMLSSAFHLFNPISGSSGVSPVSTPSAMSFKSYEPVQGSRRSYNVPSQFGSSMSSSSVVSSDPPKFSTYASETSGPLSTSESSSMTTPSSHTTIAA